MANKQSFSNSIYGAETHRAERELSAFTGAVTELFGTEQARVSTEDWLEELTLMDKPSRSKERNWRAVTIAAAARLAKRLDTATQSGYDPNLLPLPCTGQRQRLGLHPLCTVELMQEREKWKTTR